MNIFNSTGEGCHDTVSFWSVAKICQLDVIRAYLIVKTSVTETNSEMKDVSCWSVAEICQLDVIRAYLIVKTSVT